MTSSHAPAPPHLRRGIIERLIVPLLQRSGIDCTIMERPGHLVIDCALDDDGDA